MRSGLRKLTLSGGAVALGTIALLVAACGGSSTGSGPGPVNDRCSNSSPALRRRVARGATGGRGAG